MNEINLLPCPFCGGDAKLINRHDICEDEYSSYIKCEQCGIQTQEIDTTVTRYDPRPIGTYALEYLINIWNTRKT